MREYRFLVEIAEAWSIMDREKPTWQVLIRDADDLRTLLRIISDNCEEDFEVYVKAGTWTEEALL